jgi:hypothetical protein
MAMKTPEATIDFLLTCIDSIEGKVDWEAVATKTGWYKAGKFSQVPVNLLRNLTNYGLPVSKLSAVSIRSTLVQSLVFLPAVLMMLVWLRPRLQRSVPLARVVMKMGKLVMTSRTHRRRELLS